MSTVLKEFNLTLGVNKKYKVSFILENLKNNNKLGKESSLWRMHYVPTTSCIILLNNEMVGDNYVSLNNQDDYNKYIGMTNALSKTLKGNKQIPKEDKAEIIKFYLDKIKPKSEILLEQHSLRSLELNEIYTLEKVTDSNFNNTHPNGINVGYKKTSNFCSPINVNGLFYLGTLKTSLVVEIVSGTDEEAIFKTLNSTYKVKIEKMSHKCPIMSRMKDNYEKRVKRQLLRRIPVIIRIDGRSFSKYTSKMEKPFDSDFRHFMVSAMNFALKQISGAKFGYTQSDEISLLVTDYDTFETQAWFDYDVDKMNSNIASMITSKFLQKTIAKLIAENQDKSYEQVIKLVEEMNLPNFDCRCYNVPEEDVSNYFLARLKDATKNSVSAIARCSFSNKELEKKSTKQRIDLIDKETEKKVSSYPLGFTNGFYAIKEEYAVLVKQSAKDTGLRTKWFNYPFTTEQANLEFFQQFFNK